MTVKTLRPLLLLCLALALVGVSCADDAASGEAPTVSPRELDKETREILALMDERLYFFDVEAGDSFESWQLDLWTIVDGQWVNTNPAIQKSSEVGSFRIGLQQEGDQLNLLHATESGHASSTMPLPADPGGEGSAVTTGSLPEPRPIVAGEPIPLYTMLRSADGLIRTGHFGFFPEVHPEDSDALYGIAVTITFS